MCYATGMAEITSVPDVRASPPFGVDMELMPIGAWLVHIWVFGAAALTAPDGTRQAAIALSLRIMGRSGPGSTLISPLAAASLFQSQGRYQRGGRAERRLKDAPLSRPLPGEVLSL